MSEFDEVDEPYPEITFGFGSDAAAKTIHLDAEGLDLSDVDVDGK